MPDFTLHGNHDPCPACELRREAIFAEAGRRVPIPFGMVECNHCGGTGFIALTAAEITRRTAAEACRVHWPAFDERNGI